MNYSRLTPTILQRVLQAMALINNPEIEPEVRQLNQEILFREVGQSVYAKAYDMNAFDFDIAHTIGSGIDDRFYGLAKVASASVSNGTLGLDEYVQNYIDNVIGLAQRDAMTNAIESGQRPTLTRTIVAETCDWCISMAGTYTDPPPDAFARHRACDCEFRTEGFMSRNGLLNNYVKPKDR